MIPQTHAGTHTPACPGGGKARGLPETGLAALSRPIAAHGMWPISTSMARARGPEREKKQTSPIDPDAVGLGFQ